MQKLINKINNKEKGITLIALVITIVILLILAGVSIAMLTGDNGIITRANEASEKTKYAGAKEAVEVEIAGSLDNKGKYDANIAKANLEKNLGATVILNPDGTLDVYHGGYHFKVSADGKVTSIEKEEGTETSGTKFKQVSSGNYYTLALDEKGKIWSWGDNSKGQLGNGKSNEVVIKPTKINSDMEYLQVVANEKGISFNFCLALDREGNIWSWGENYEGQLGNGESGGYGKNVLIPTKITNGIKYTQIETTENGGVALDSEGNIWTWGSNSYGQLGNGSKGEAVLVPTKVTNGVKYTQISGGSSNVLALDSEGNLWTWGYNNNGQIGNGQKGDGIYHVPIQVTNGIEYVQVSVGDSHMIALDSEGNIWSWGNNREGQLGNGSKGEDVLVPTKVTNGIKYTQISADQHCLALDEEGNIWSWGSNSKGQLGNGESGFDKNVLIPTKITNETKYKQISAGFDHSLALDEEGNIWSWGGNSSGQLGNGKSGYSENVLIPTKITNGTKYTSIVAGNNTTLALDNDGNLWVCGSNTIGILGMGIGDDICVLQKLDLETKFKEVEADRPSYLIDEDGYMWSTGIPYPGRSTAYTTFQKIRI